MTDPMHQQLLGHLLGALDDDEHEHVDALLEHDEEYCNELLRWRRRLAPLEAMRPEYEPPPGLAERACRYVASWVPAFASSEAGKPKYGMSSCRVPPSSVAPLGWLDVAAVAFLLLTAVMLVFPAIDGSRFQARLASCQEGLRQFGLALNLYSDQQQDALGELAAGGRLTNAGAVAADRIRTDYYADRRQIACPDAWLAVQGVLCRCLEDDRLPDILEPPQSTLMGGDSLFVPVSQPQGIFAANTMNEPQNEWSGTRRDGTNEGRRFLPSASADVPLLADAPSAELPGLHFASHRGRGRNVLFEDGHAGFQPSTAFYNTAHPLPHSADSASGGISAPIVFVSR